MTTILSRLEKIESRRTAWDVTAPTSSPDRRVPKTLARCLATRYLELDVREWTLQAIQNLPERGAIAEILDLHADDEIKHDRQLQYLADYWGWEPIDEAAWDELYDRWQSTEFNPLAKKLVLEAMGLFQVLALMLVAAPDDLYTQTVRQWVLFDEAAHVASARVLVRELGTRIPRELINLGEDTVRWLCKDLDQGTTDRMLRISREILSKGQSSDGNTLSTVTVPEFFTQRSNSQIKY